MASQSASPAGHHNIIVQASGDGINVQVGLPWLELIPAERRVRTAPRREIDILDPAFQAVPLVGRDSDLDFVRGWLAADQNIAITALTGAGGSGKTRLALEVLRTLPEQWQGGFLTGQEARRFLDARNLASWSWHKPTFIVVDYAALIAETLANWFRELADHPIPEHRLRILLLERHADKGKGWYGDLTDGSFQGRHIRELFSPLEPTQISPLTELDQRRSVLAAALEVAAKVKPGGDTGLSLIPRVGTDPWFDQRLAHDQWKDPLLLVMAAVIAASSGIHAALKLSRPELAKELANRERARVRNSVEDRTAKDLLVHLYACITLCGGLSWDNAAAVAEKEFASFRMHYPGGSGRAAKDLATLLGGRDWLPPMTPDLLGEAFLLVVFGEIGPSVIARLGPLASERVAATVIRSVQDFSHWGEPAPMQWAKALAAQGERDLDVLLAIEEALPQATLALRPLAVAVTQSLIFYRSQRSDLSERSLAGLSRLWNNLSVRQSAMGQRAEALASIAEALRIRRALAEANPDAFLADLAMSLNNQATMQSEIGQSAEALASIAEAVRHYHALAEANPDAFLPDLAMSLNNQAKMQRAMGQRAEALASIAEAVRRYRALAEANPDAFLPDLAISLNNQATMQSAMGQRAEALASIAEAVRIRRALAEANPDAFLPDLAISLNNQATMQRAMGQRAEALASIAEAVRIRRALAEANPDAFLPGLAMSLSVHGDCLASLERLSDARHAASESLVCLAPFCARFPGVFDGLAKATLQDYMLRTQELGEEPDEAVLMQYTDLFKTGERE